MLRKLDDAGIDWEMAVDSDEDRSVEVLISADIAVGAILEDSIPPHLEAVATGGALPELGVQQINLYVLTDRDEVMTQMAEIIGQAFCSSTPTLLRQA